MFLRNPFSWLVRIATWLTVGTIFTILLSWLLAMLTPQRHWRQRTIAGWSAAERPGVCFMIDQFEILGSCRRTWAFDGDSLRNIYLRPAIEYPKKEGQAVLCWDNESTNLGFLSWGSVHEMRDQCFHLTSSEKITPAMFAKPVKTRGCEHATGWPLLALYYDIVHVAPGVDKVANGIPIEIKLSRPSALNTIQALPLQPVWIGLAFNSVFWGGVFWGATAGITGIKIEMRKRRNRCVYCSYPIGDQAVCSECGCMRRFSRNDSGSRELIRGGQKLVAPTPSHVRLNPPGGSSS